MDYTELRELIEIDSPTGYTTKAAHYVAERLRAYGWAPEFTNKGAVKCALGDAPRLALTAHVDTLGLIVAGIKADGTLTVSSLGAPSFSSSEGEYVRVITQAGGTFNGTLLLYNPSTHSHSARGTQKRPPETMHIRIDEPIRDYADAVALGISA